MKLRTRIMLNAVKDSYVNDKLKEMLNEGKLSDEQVQYIIKNTNINYYILQNALPIAEALNKGVYIEDIEYVAKLLKDACEESSFALEDGKGALFNKVPDILDHILKTEDVKHLTDEGKFKIEKMVNIYYTSYELMTSDASNQERFWELLIKTYADGDKWIDELNCNFIKKYNDAVSSYFNTNHKDSFLIAPPHIQDLLDTGMSLFKISIIDFSRTESFYNLLLAEASQFLLNDKEYKEIRCEIDESKYYLCIEKYDNVRLVSDDSEETGVREELYEDISIRFQNKENENDYILSYNYDQSQFAVNFIQLADKHPEIKLIKNEDYLSQNDSENIQIVPENKKYIFNNIDMLKTINTVECNVWYGKGSREEKFVSDSNILQIEANIIEPSHESFTTAPRIILNGELLYGCDTRSIGMYQNEKYQQGKFSNIEDALEYVKKNIDIDNLENISKDYEKDEIESISELNDKDIDDGLQL